MHHRTQPGKLPVQCDAHIGKFAKGWRSVALAFFVSASGWAWAAPVDVYRGTLGSTAVVMELGEPQADGVREGRYFYPRYGVDIPLKGPLHAVAEAQPLAPELLEQQGGDAPVFTNATLRTVVWRMQVQGDGSLAGEWEDGIRAKKLRFHLKHIAHYDPELLGPIGMGIVTQAYGQSADSALAQDGAITEKATPYDFLRMHLQPLQQGKEVVLAPNLAWRPVRDARTQFWYPRLTRHPDAKILAQTNAVLEQRHWAMGFSALGCKSSIYLDMGPAAGSLGNYNEEQITVSFLSTALMSVVESGSTDCGGAHPNNHFNPFVLDLRRGGYLDFRRLFKGAAYRDYSLAFSPRMQALIRQAVDKQPEPRDDDDCTDLLPQYMAVMLDKPDKVSFVISGIGHAMGVCLGSGVSVPFSQLKPVLAPGAKAYLQPGKP